MPPAKFKGVDANQPTLHWKTHTPVVCTVNCNKPKEKYNIVKHNKEFDPWLHGYIWKKGCMWYRRPDGVDVRAYAGVNKLTEEGELLPLC